MTRSALSSPQAYSMPPFWQVLPPALLQMALQSLTPLFDVGQLAPLYQAPLHPVEESESIDGEHATLHPVHSSGPAFAGRGDVDVVQPFGQSTQTPL